MLGCDGLFYHPTRREYDKPERLRLRYESVRFATRDGLELHGWFFPANGPAAGTVLHLHGNAGNVTAHFHQIGWLPACGWNVLCFDYRGYGQSQGRITRAGSIADAHVALDYLLHRPGVDPRRIVAFGQSLGGAVGIVLTAERPELRGLAADGAFDSYRGIATWHIRRNPLLFIVAWWVPLLMGDGHDPIDCVARVSPRPLLILHGTADRIVDPRMARRLYDAAREPKELWLVDGSDHYEALEEMGEVNRPRLEAFFRRCVE
ncbi:MAG TPA: alpha/beta hydrolase [Phycisphaerae bacterium]|nr:alpha/beta hydrolase [Phycisphaerae bacterium]